MAMFQSSLQTGVYLVGGGGLTGSRFLILKYDTSWFGTSARTLWANASL